MENKLENQFFILETAEVALIGLFSLVSEKISDLYDDVVVKVSVSIYSIILWTAVTSAGVDEEDRWSFRRSVKIVSIAAVVQNIYQVIFLIAKTTNTFNLLESVRADYENTVGSKFLWDKSSEDIVFLNTKI